MAKKQIIEALQSTNRAGMDKLIKWLETNGFFTCPASTRFHGAYKGGLANHSWNVYRLLSDYVEQFKLDTAASAGQKPLKIEPENISIVGLLHDICKVGAYIGDKAPYKWNKQQPKGHATLSLTRIKQFIKLTELEEMMIKYHMGPYGLNEFYDENDWQQGEYPLRGDHSQDENMTKEESQKARYGQSLANAWFHNPIVKVMYICDELATLQEKNDAA